MNNKNNPIEFLVLNNFKYRAFDKFRRGMTPGLVDTVKLLISGVLFEPFNFILKNYPGTIGLIARKLVYKILCNKIGERVIIDTGISTNGYRNIEIDDYVWVDKNVELLADTGFIKIGKRVHIAPYSNIVGLAGVTIEDFAAVGRYAQVLSHSVVASKGKYMSGPMVIESEKGYKSEPIIIRRNAVISSGAIIMPGVEIGEGAIVGPNSLIISNVKPWNIMLGVPARPVGIREAF
jgi:acetyltransferase-like isoleucine patch superfamily enzyme